MTSQTHQFALTSAAGPCEATYADTVHYDAAAAKTLISSASTDLFKDIFAGDIVKATTVGDTGNDAGQVNVSGGNGGCGCGCGVCVWGGGGTDRLRGADGYTTILHDCTALY